MINLTLSPISTQQQVIAAFDLVGTVSTLANAVLAGAAVWAAVIASRGLSTWRHQLKGDSEYQLARRLLRCTYRVRDAIRFVRSPFMDGAEILAALREAGIDPEKERAKVHSPEANMHAYNARWKQVAAAWSDLSVEVLEAEVLWGQEAAAKVDGLSKCTNRLRRALERYLMIKANQAKGIASQAGDNMDELDGIVFDSSDVGKDDEFAGELRVSITEIEAYIRPHLEIKERV